MIKYVRIIFCCWLLTASIDGFGSGGSELIPAGDKWKYYDKSNFPGENWFSKSFDDHTWQEGNAEFGYGDGDEKTQVSFGKDAQKKIITTYFRKTFSVQQTNFKNLELQVKCDDGAVVFINGKEVFRTNMPGGKITAATDASGAISGDAENAFIITHLKPTVLISGENIIAVEVHQDSPKSSDLSFDLSLAGSDEAEVIRGPYLQSATPTSMIVRWRTSVEQGSKVYYGTNQLTDSIVETKEIADHTINIKNLQPLTKYFYRVDGKTIRDDNSFFITPPAENSAIPVRIWSMGDFGTGNTIQKDVRDAYYNFSKDKYTNIVLWLGDNAYPTGTDDQYSSNVFTPYKDILKKSLVYSTCGNHDLFYSNTEKQTGPYFDNFTFPVNGECGGVASSTEAYYSFNYSNIHFVCLEANVDSFKNKTEDMIQWLRADLSANKMKWIIAYFHCPPYSKGYHDSDKNYNMTFMREKVVPILEEFGTDLVLSGHDHDYERTYLLNGHYGISSTLKKSMIVDKGSKGIPVKYTKKSNKGTIYMVVGCAGELQQIQSSWPHKAMAKYYNKVYGSLVIDVSGNTLSGKMISNQRTVVDDFVIEKD